MLRSNSSSGLGSELGYCYFGLVPFAAVCPMAKLKVKGWKIFSASLVSEFPKFIGQGMNIERGKG